MIRPFLLILPGTLAPRLATFVTVLFGSHLLPQSEFGYFALVMVLGEICEMSAVGWVRIILIRYGSANNELLRSNVRRACLVALVGVFAAMLATVPLCWIASREVLLEMVVATSAYIIAFAMLRIGLILLQVNALIKEYAALEVVRATIYMAITALTMASTSSFLFASLIGTTSVAIVGAYAFRLGWLSTKEGTDTTIPWSKFRNAGLPLILISILGFVISSLDKITTASVFSKEVLATYAVAFALGRQGFDVLANAINVRAFPQLVKSAQGNNGSLAPRELGNTLALLLAVALPTAAVLFASRSVIAEAILPQSYWHAIVLASPIVGVGAIFLNIKNFVYDNIFHVTERNYLQLPTMAFGALASFCVAIWAPSPDPHVSAALIFLSGSFVSLMLAVILSRKLITVKMNWRAIYSSALISIASFLIADHLANLSVSPILCLSLLVLVGVISLGSSLFSFRCKFQF